MKRILIAVFLLVTAKPLYAEVLIRATTDPQKVEIGEHFKYLLTVTHDGEKIKPIAELPSSPQFEVINGRVTKNDGNMFEVSFTLAPFDTGRLQLPAYSVTWKNDDGGTDTKVSDASFIDVKSVIGKSDKPDVEKIEGAVEAKRELEPYLLDILPFIIIIAIIVAIYLYMKKRKKPISLVEVPVKTPYQLAIEKLDSIKKENLYDKGDVKGYFDALSETIRRYISDSCHVDAMEKTTAELATGFPLVIRNYKEMTLEMLETSDNAKFAKEIPTKTEAEEVLISAYRLVNETGKLYETD